MDLTGRLAVLGLTLPPAPAPVANYLPAVRSGNLVFTSGQLPLVDGELVFRGKIGLDLSLEEGQEAARICVLNALAAVVELLGRPDAIKRVVKLVGFVNSNPGFTQQPQVINGASQLLVDLMGEAGRHCRSAVGVGDLPLGAAVELEMILEVT